MRYYKKCQDCNGQGKLAKRGSNYHLSISCPCEGGFVDCTSEVEAMRALLEEMVKEADEYSLWLAGRAAGTVEGSAVSDVEISLSLIDRVKALLASMKA